MGNILLPETGEAINSLAGYRACGGYQALLKVLSIPPSEVIEIVKRSGLRGRGGAGFPTGQKWELAARKNSPKKYVVCNAAEGEPGTLKDRHLIRNNPHQILEGVMIAAYAIGADEAYIFVKQQFVLEFEMLKATIREVEESGIPGGGFSIKLHAVAGPNVYVAGEETAMLEAIQGRPPMPRPKPPFYPIQHGLFGRPTLVNNAETLANLPPLISRGVEWFRSFGTAQSPGTMLFTLTGDVERPGVVELPLGTPLRKLIWDFGGGIRGGRTLKAVFPGGPSQAVLTAEQVDTPLDFESLRAAGSSLGTGGVAVYSDAGCMVRTVLKFCEFFSDESCGQCPPCKLGTENLEQILRRIEEGQGEPRDLEQINRVCGMIRGRGFCDLVTSAVRSVESALRLFRSEFESHIRERGCPLQSGI